MLELGGLLDVHISILHISRPQENCRSRWRTPLFRAPPTWLSDAQRLHNKPPTPVSRKSSNFGPRAPPVLHPPPPPHHPHPPTQPTTHPSPTCLIRARSSRATRLQ